MNHYNSLTGLTRHLSLKEMGEALLVAEIEERAERLGITEQINAAIRLAAVVHKDQTRSNRGPLPRDTYITHPLRNTLRLMRYGVTDSDILVASLLHDTVEDGADIIVHSIAFYTVDSRNSEADTRRLALRFIAFIFGDEVARIVLGVTNPILSDKNMGKADKREHYRVHVEAAIKDPKIAVVKLADFVDNAVGLYHNTGMLQQARFHLATKYFPLLMIFTNRIWEKDVRDILSESGKSEAMRQLVKGAEELQKIIEEPDRGI